MADTRVQLEVEDWLRQNWMPKQFGQQFRRERLRLTSGGFFDFDAVSADNSIVATISDIAPLRTAAPDYAETERLKASLAQLRASRQSFFLSAAELEPIFHWKLGTQYARVRDKLAHNSDVLYQIVTRAAFEVPQLADTEYETELRVSILTALRGVGVGVASAILALTAPDRYCVIDFRGWRAVFDEERTTFSIRGYNRYLAEVRRLAQVLKWAAQEVDLAIWEYDSAKHGRAA